MLGFLDHQPACSSQSAAAEEASGNGTNQSASLLKSPISELPEHGDAVNGTTSTEKPPDSKTGATADSSTAAPAEAAPTPPGNSVSSGNATQESNNKAPRSKGAHSFTALSPGFNRGRRQHHAVCKRRMFEYCPRARESVAPAMRRLVASVQGKGRRTPSPRNRSRSGGSGRRSTRPVKKLSGMLVWQRWTRRGSSLTAAASCW